MNISLSSILKNPLFEHAQLVAGTQGQHRSVRRISVFDAPFGTDVIEKQIVMPGDFFVTGLLQFGDDPEEVLEVLRILVQAQGSGVCLISRTQDHLINGAVRKFCDENAFPLVHIREDISYAEIMDTVNRYITMENLNVMNQLKLDKIISYKGNTREKQDLLMSMNHELGEFIQVVYFRGKLRSKLMEDEWNLYYLSCKEDIYIHTPGAFILILSAENEKRMKTHLEVTQQRIRAYYHVAGIGIGRVYPRTQVDRSIHEARSALSMVAVGTTQVQEYDPLSSLQLLLPMRNARELQDYYNAFYQMLRVGVSAEGMRELMSTLRQFVQNGGDYSQTAQKMSQHENTIRYRINRIKSLLGIEHDTIHFYETIALVVKIEQILQQNDLL